VLSHSARDIRLEFEPIVGTLGPPAAAEPMDLPPGRVGASIRGISFRGIMPPDEASRFRPDAPISRAEFAEVLCRVRALELDRAAPPALRDVTHATPFAEGIARAGAAGT
jgi:hypothetical protein